MSNALKIGSKDEYEIDPTLLNDVIQEDSKGTDTLDFNAYLRERNLGFMRDI